MKIVLVILIVFCLTILLLVGYHGAFHKVVVSQSKTKTMWFAYEKFIGPYQNSGPIADKIYYDLIKNNSVETYKGAGIYFDNPKEKNPVECRSIVGCIIEEEDYDKIEQLKNKYTITKIESSMAIQSTFPYNGKFSILFGVLKAHKAINTFRKENNIDESPLMEIYNVPEKKIEYIASPETPFKEFDKY